MQISEDGVCSACRAAERKAETIDWHSRGEALMRLLDAHRGHGTYDCVVPGSGGKDSCYAAHALKYTYGMSPLLVTWAPTLPTSYGLHNYRGWRETCGGHHVVRVEHGETHRELTRRAVRNLLHPFQTFIVGQKYLAPKVALEYGIPLVFYGESEAEYGNPIAETESSLRQKYYWADDLSRCYIAGEPYADLARELGADELAPYLPVSPAALDGAALEVHYLGYYLRWRPQDAYYYATQHCKFAARPQRTDGTYSQYNSIDDKIDDFGKLLC